ncbi:hypothetical protein B0H13DRAFT_1899593 [Mycena leptocephala]|nr:hypothetical protein B0H13DRAFT_1899593 [Mycena leptocephala]
MHTFSLPAFILLSVLNLPSYAQFAVFVLGVGNLTAILPQCQGLCDAYNVMVTNCQKNNIFAQGFKQCECTDPNFKVIEDCFDCQAVNATQEDVMQDLLDEIVDNCNDRFGSPDLTISIAPQKIVPTAAFSRAVPEASGTGTPGPNNAASTSGIPISLMVEGSLNCPVVSGSRKEKENLRKGQIYESYDPPLNRTDSPTNLGKLFNDGVRGAHNILP